MNELCPGGDRLDLPAQLLDMAVDRAVAHVALVGIHSVHELLSPVDAAGVVDQQLQQPELHGGKLKIMAMQRNPVAVLVQNESLPLDCLSIDGATQHSLDPGHHLAGTERFADIIIGAELKAE